MKAMPAMSTPRVGCAATSSFGSRSKFAGDDEALLIAAGQAAAASVKRP